MSSFPPPPSPAETLTDTHPTEPIENPFPRGPGPAPSTASLSGNLPRLALPGRKRPYIMAHRGSRTRLPENTLPAFRHAQQAGAALIETDLRLTRDGVVVCLHDPTVDRTTNGSGPVDQLSFSAVRRLQVRNPDGSFSGEGIPTLAEVAACLAPENALALELKSDAFREPTVCLEVAHTLHAAGILDRSVVLSFSRPRLKAFAKAVPEIPRGLISLRGLTPTPGYHLLGPAWPMLILNPWFVRTAHRGGQLVCPLDPKPDSRLWIYLLLGCDAILTDDPAATRKALLAWEKWRTER